ncbi:MAG: methylated-DNA--[protein]-cysteine S-methyltransferase [Alkalibacterium sp.]|nr:methylated-DNA--[protein]-cysteine S-methyltransferase [Alkalibacterium sp.]
MEETVYYSLISYEDWSFYIAATLEGLCFVGSMPASKEECLNWIQSRFPLATIEENQERLAPYEKAVTDYLSKRSSLIDVPVVQIGTSFQKKIWNSLRTIPYGETITYSELAVKNDLSPKAARSVGSAIGKNPLLIVYPCHRVVPKSSLPRGFRGGLDMKMNLLTLERD